MSWRLNVVILAEGWRSALLKVAGALYQHDSSVFSNSQKCYLKPIQGSDEAVLFYSYRRRDRIPAPLLAKLSRALPTVRFALLGSELGFEHGPAMRAGARVGAVRPGSTTLEVVYGGRTLPCSDPWRATSKPVER